MSAWSATYLVASSMHDETSPAPLTPAAGIHRQRAAARRGQQLDCGRQLPPVRLCKAARRTSAARGHQQRDHERGGAVAGGAPAARPVGVDGAARAHGLKRGLEVRGARQRQRGQVGNVRAAAGIGKHVVAWACSNRSSLSMFACSDGMSDECVLAASQTGGAARAGRSRGASGAPDLRRTVRAAAGWGPRAGRRRARSLSRRPSCARWHHHAHLRHGPPPAAQTAAPPVAPSALHGRGSSSGGLCAWVPDTPQTKAPASGPAPRPLDSLRDLVMRKHVECCTLAC